jgi:hypothetical protein
MKPTSVLLATFFIFPYGYLSPHSSCSVHLIKFKGAEYAMHQDTTKAKKKKAKIKKDTMETDPGSGDPRRLPSRTPSKPKDTTKSKPKPPNNH